MGAPRALGAPVNHLGTCARCYMMRALTEGGGVQNTLGGARGDSKNPQGILHPRSKYTRVFRMGVPKTGGAKFPMTPAGHNARYCACAVPLAWLLRECRLHIVSGWLDRLERANHTEK